ncbi:hypothetical protein TNCV_578821 [Trichonephila clavipes]|nr:hypothetical protein TNCV_578821 [Trichonephila clavipes]
MEFFTNYLQVMIEGRGVSIAVSMIRDLQALRAAKRVSKKKSQNVKERLERAHSGLATLVLENNVINHVLIIIWCGSLDSGVRDNSDVYLVTVDQCSKL